MILDDMKIHFSEMLKMLKRLEGWTEDELLFLSQMEEFESRFKVWFPQVFCYIEGGVLQGASANCRMSLDLFDRDNEEATEKDELGKLFHEREYEWNEMIREGHASGLLIPIM